MFSQGGDTQWNSHLILFFLFSAKLIYNFQIVYSFLKIKFSLFVFFKLFLDFLNFTMCVIFVIP